MGSSGDVSWMSCAGWCFLRKIKVKGSLMIILTKRFILKVVILVLFMVFLNLISFCQILFTIIFFTLLFLLQQLAIITQLAFSELLNPAIPNEHCPKDSSTSCEEIQAVSANDSFNIYSLLSIIPLTETKEITFEVIFRNTTNLNISRDELKQLFKFATSVTHFLLKDDVYDQTYGFSMGSPLGRVLANLFMDYHERN